MPSTALGADVRITRHGSLPIGATSLDLPSHIRVLGLNKCSGRVGERLKWSGACLLEQRAVFVVRLSEHRVPGQRGQRRSPLPNLRNRVFEPEAMAAEYRAGTHEAERFRSLDESVQDLRGPIPSALYSRSRVTHAEGVVSLATRPEDSRMRDRPRSSPPAEHS